MDSDTHQGEFDPPSDPPDADPPLYKSGTTGERIRSFTHSIGLVIGAFALSLAFAFVYYSILESAGFDVYGPELLPAWASALVTALQFIAFYIVSLSYLRWRSSTGSLFGIGLPSLRDCGWVVLGFVILIGSLMVVTAVFSFFDITPAENVAITQGEKQPVYFLYLIPIAFFLNGPAEELLFRGLVQGLFRRAYGILPGVGIAAVLFGIVHVVALLPSDPSTISLLTTLAVLSVLGAILGLIYERTQNLVVPMAIHALFNVFQFSIAYLRTTGRIGALV